MKLSLKSSLKDSVKEFNILTTPSFSFTVYFATQYTARNLNKSTLRSIIIVFFLVKPDKT